MHYGQICDTYCDLERNYLSEARNKRWGDEADGHRYRSEYDNGESGDYAKRQNPISYLCHSDGVLYPFVIDHRPMAGHDNVGAPDLSAASAAELSNYIFVQRASA
jgi:hypothetical protein